MADTYTYYKEQSLPAIPLEWRDKDGELIDFSSGWTFSAKLLNTATGAIVFTITGTITGAATSPNLTINLADAEFASVTAGTYDLYVKGVRTSDSKDRVFRPDNLPRIVLKDTPA